MPSQRAKKDSEARRRFKEHLQRSLDCVSNTIWRVSKSADPDQEVLFLAGAPVAIGRAGESNLYLAATLSYGFHVVERDHRVNTKKYIYTVSESADLATELFAWHWHPPDRSETHLHVAGYKKLHVPTGRVSFEQIAHFLISDMNVAPRKTDWEAVLAAAHERHLQFRTWN